MKKILFYILLFFAFHSCANSSVSTFRSPNGTCSSKIIFSKNGVSCNLVYNGDTLIRKAELIVSDTLGSLLRGVELTNISESLVNESWETVNGKNKTVINHYKNYLIDLKNSYTQNFQLELRLYDKGFAYRYILPELVTKIKEKSTINFGGDFTFWAFNGENHNVGPAKLSTYGEKRYKIRLCSKLNLEIIWQFTKRQS